MFLNEIKKEIIMHVVDLFHYDTITFPLLREFLDNSLMRKILRNYETNDIGLFSDEYLEK
jgi:hypothetical protein